MLLTWQLVLIMVFFCHACGEPGVVYKTMNIECVTAPKYATNATCHLKAINWNRSVARMHVDVVEPLKNLSVHLKWFKKDYSNKFQPFLVDVQLKICDVLARKNFITYGVIMKNILKRFTNVNHTCPYSGHIFAQDIYFDEQYLPILPLGLYKCSMKVSENFAYKPAEFVGFIAMYVQSMEPVKNKGK